MLAQLLQNPESEMVITAVVGSIGPVQQSKNGKNYQVVRLQDGASVADVKIFQGNGQPLQPSMAGQTLTFKLANKPYRGQASIAGYWQASAKTLQQPVQQALQNLAPLTQPQGQPNGRENGTIERQCAYKSAPDSVKEAIFANRYPYDVFDELSKYFQTGIKPDGEPEPPI